MPTVLLIPVAICTGIVDTGGKFAASIIETGGCLPQVSTTLAKMVEKFATSVVDTCANLPPVSLTLMAAPFLASIVDTGGKYPPMSTIHGVFLEWSIHWKGYSAL